MNIPRNKFKEGIELCKRNVLDYLNEARMVAQKGSLHHAYVNVQLAIEETGKALWLKDELQNGSFDPVNVPDVVFGKNGGKSHWKKFNRASKMLNPNLLWVCKGDFDPEDFDPQDFDVGKELEELRKKVEEQERIMKMMTIVYGEEIMEKAIERAKAEGVSKEFIEKSELFEIFKELARIEKEKEQAEYRKLIEEPNNNNNHS